MPGTSGPPFCVWNIALSATAAAVAYRSLPDRFVTLPCQLGSPVATAVTPGPPTA